MPDTKPTRDQQRAQAAFRKVSAKKGKKDAEDYGRQCLRLPTLIRQDGLCLTLAFLSGKGASKPYFADLTKDFLEILGTTTEEIRNVGAVKYQIVSRDAIRTAVWFKRYAEGVLDVAPESDKDH